MTDIPIIHDEKRVVALIKEARAFTSLCFRTAAEVEASLRHKATEDEHENQDDVRAHNLSRRYLVHHGDNVLLFPAGGRSRVRRYR